MLETYAIGLMSGTSLDGLDISYVKFWEGKKQFQFEILKASTLPYTKEWISKLKNAYNLGIENIKEIDEAYGRFLAESTLDFINENSINNIDFVASHGHTIYHQPEKGITIQIGNGALMAKILQKPIVNDFRSADVALGGQGAPLVPIGDRLLFSEFDACLNVGGFANISFEQNNSRIAFDICPVNIVLNPFAQRLGFQFDDKGSLAKSGNLNLEVFNTLNNLDFYHQDPPKSLGLEWVEKEIFPLLNNMQPKDVLHTFTHHVANQINTILKEHRIKKLLVTGGGTYNDYLISLLESSEIVIPSPTLIEYKEALVFAFLGYLRLQNKVNILASVTGATQNHSSGRYFYPKSIKKP